MNRDRKVEILLTVRLQKIADFIPLGNKIADIGTDHAYIPIYAVEHCQSPFAVAVDVHEGPYKRAREFVERQKLAKKISVRLGNGLEPLQAGEVDIIIMAGMGGILMQEILSISLAKWKTAKQLILQPQQATDKVRAFLYGQNWHLTDEALVEENGHLYEVLVAKPGRENMPSLQELFLGPILLRKRPPLFAKHQKQLLKKYSFIMKQLQSSAPNGERFFEVKKILAALKGSDKKC